MKSIENATSQNPLIQDMASPYVAAAGRNMLYFIDIRFDMETARHIKDQIERATVTRMDEYISIDEILATAKVVNAKTGMTTFVFDPPYARVLFARGINRQNPELKLPEHEIAGPWLISYDLGVKSTQQCYNSSNDEGMRSCCSRAVDTPREDGETDADYYQRMDKLHWQKTVAPAESDIIN